MDTPPVPPSPPAPPPPPPPAPPPPPPSAAGAKGSNRTVIIVLCIVGVLILLFGGCVLLVRGCARYVGHRAQQYTDTARKNPQLAAIEFAVAMSPDVEIVSKNESTGKITLRNKKTGEVVTLDSRKLTSEGTGEALDQIMRGVKPAAAAAESEPEAEPEPAQPVRRSPPAEPTVTSARASAFAATLRKFPDFVPAYRGGTTVGATLNSFGGNVVGNYAFTTNDSPETTADFYEKRLTSAGFNIISRQNDSNDNGPTVTLVAQHPASQITATCKAEIDDGKTHVEIDFVKPNGG